LYVADTLNYTIRQIAPLGTDWVVITIAGAAGIPGTNDGPGAMARFDKCTALKVDGLGNIYVADFGNSAIRKLTATGTNWWVSTLAGLSANLCASNSSASATDLLNPSGVAVDGIGNVYVADFGNNEIRKLTLMA